MRELLTDEAFWQVFLIGAAALSLLLTCKSLVQLFVGSQSTIPWMEVVCNAAAIVRVAILTADAMWLIDRRLAADWEPLPGLALFGIAAVSTWSHVKYSALKVPARDLLARPATWILLAVSIAASSWSSYRFYESAAPVYQELPSAAEPRLEEVPEYVGISDRGRKIRLFRFVSLPASAPAESAAAGLVYRPRKETVIAQSQRDPRSNCHGWVFTGGRFLLDHVGVATILEDNGYQPCSDPRAGDVIIYHLASGRIVHTGLVSGVLGDGTVLIESKWDLEGRYVHRPEDQPYSQYFTYYRSTRSGHEIGVVGR